MGTRITDLPAATIVNPTDVAPIVQSGTTKQAAVSLIKTTNASELTSGTVAVARLPLGTTSSAGALQLGTTAGTACEGSDARLSNSRTPTGTAGGDLTGSYPNPTLAPLSPSPAGTFGSSTAIPVVTVNSKGQVTAVSAATAAGTVSSVNVSGGSTGLTFSNGPIVSSGTIVASGTLALANGGTGATTAAGARTNLGLAPSATIDTTNASNITSGTLNATRLSDTGVTAGTYGSTSSVAQVTVDSKGRVTGAVNIPISSSAGGTVTSVGVTSSTLSITNSPITSSGDIGIELSSITTAQLPASGVTPGTYGSTTQIPVLGVDSKGRVTSISTAAISSLGPSGVTAGTYGSATSVGRFSVNSNGIVTGASNQLIALTTAQISGLAASATTDTTNASNITSGTLNVNRLATSGVTAGTYGSTAAIPVLTVDALGRLTAASTVALPGGGGGTPTSVGYLRETITTSATAATGTINFDAITQPTLYYTSNASGNFTLNIRGDGTTTLNSLLTTTQSLTVTFLNTNGTTAYGISALNIDGSARTVKWLSGTGAIPTPNASSIDAWTFTIIKTASNTFTVLGSLSKFF
jgi:hypothetical protein